MISLKNVSLSNILTNITISFPEGGYTGIAGPNGSGKSSLARIIKGIQDQSQGEVYIDGAIRHRGKVTSDIGLVLSSPENQLISSSIEEDVAFGLENMNLPSQEIAQRTQEALKLWGLWELKDVPAHHLSAGQQQMLVIAGIMVTQPRYLIIDEGTSMIDLQGRSMVLDAIKKINKENGVGVIHISHELSDFTGADSIAILDKGKIVWEGGPSKLHHLEPLLVSLGMELPPLIKLKTLMLNSGYDISDDALTVEEMAEEIARIARPGRG